jgi:osmotically-inducible protein OsmY
MERQLSRALACLTVSLLSSAAELQAQDRPAWPPASSAPTSPERTGTPDKVVLQALQANPITAPYAITTTWKKGQIVLSGRVGTSQIHDAAVRTVIDLGYPLRDDLVIDTGEVHRVALERSIAQPAASGWGPLAGSSPYFLYPPPLFGRVDDPFFGFEPPLVSFPPWAVGRSGPVAEPAVAARGPSGAVPQPDRSFSPGPVKGQIELTVDAAGQVFLRGLVASEVDKKIIEEEARNTPGVSRVYSELRVAQARSETPPPPPQPYQPEGSTLRPAAPRQEPQRTAPTPTPGATQRPPAEFRPVAPDLSMARDGQKLSIRVAEALGRSPALSGLPITIASRGDVVTLAGKLPSAYEAMLAYRAVEQTPGVREIVDQLQFPVPDENHPNPLRDKARPEDLEPYLSSQIRRHLGELAHVDRVRSRGDLLEIRGSILTEEEQDRAQAILRSMPLLRDFRLDAAFRRSQ